MINKDDLLVDIFNLDKECQKQASLYYSIAEGLSAKRKERDQQELRVKITIAETDSGVRATFLTPEGKKPTEDAIKNKVALNVQVQEAQYRLIDLDAEVVILETSVKAIEQKKSSLDNLVKLYTVGYFQDKTCIGSTNDQVQTTQTQLQNQLNNREE